MKNSKKKGLVFEKKSLTELQHGDVKNIQGGKDTQYIDYSFIDDLIALIKPTRN